MDNANIGNLYMYSREVLLVPGGFLMSAILGKMNMMWDNLKCFLWLFFPQTFSFNAGPILIRNWLLRREKITTFDFNIFIVKRQSVSALPSPAPQKSPLDLLKLSLLTYSRLKVLSFNTIRAHFILTSALWSWNCCPSGKCPWEFKRLIGDLAAFLFLVL